MIISIKTPKEELEKEHNCKKCGHCCYMGSGVVLEKEIPELAKGLKMSPEKFKKKYLEEFVKFNTKRHRFKQMRFGEAPHGRCVFLNMEKDECSIQDIKPLHCRVTSCDEHGEDAQKWFDVNHFLNLDDASSVREYAIYLKFNEPLPGAQLQDLLPKEKLDKIMNFEVDENERKNIFKSYWD